MSPFEQLSEVRNVVDSLFATDSQSLGFSSENEWLNIPENSEDFISKILSKYLDTYSHNTLGVFSKRSKISKSYLSEVKNNKKTPTRKYAEQILRECHIPAARITDYLNWQDSILRSSKPELFINNYSVDGVSELNPSMARVLTGNLYLLKAYDEIFTQELGLSKEYITRKYGEILNDEIMVLVNENVLSISDQKYFANSEKTLSFCEKDSFNLMKTILNNEQKNSLNNLGYGLSCLTYSRVSGNGKGVIQSKLKTFYKDITSDFKKYEVKDLNEEGHFLMWFDIVSGLKAIALISVLMMSQSLYTDGSLYAGGVGGHDNTGNAGEVRAFSIVPSNDFKPVLEIKKTPIISNIPKKADSNLKNRSSFIRVLQSLTSIFKP